jgi:hypothetical protein
MMTNPTLFSTCRRRARDRMSSAVRPGLSSIQIGAELRIPVALARREKSSGDNRPFLRRWASM